MVFREGIRFIVDKTKMAPSNQRQAFCTNRRLWPHHSHRHRDSSQKELLSDQIRSDRSADNTSALRLDPSIQNTMASNGEQLDLQGVDTIVSRNKQWRISTRKRPILKAGPIDAMNEKLGIPVPEMIFGDNLVAIEHIASGWAIEFNAFDALDRVSKTADGMLQVAYSKEWQRDRYVLPGFCNNVKI